MKTAWNGSLKNVDDLMAWLYNKDILNKTDKKRKDSIFRQYYRYYNDGDTPRGVLKKYKISGYDRDKIKVKLEEYLRSYISDMLKKYSGKYSRQDFYLDRKLDNLNNLLQSVNSSQSGDSILFWADRTDNKDLIIKAEQLNINYELLKEELNQYNPDMFKMRSLEYIINQGNTELTENFKKEYRDLQESIIDFGVIVKNKITDLEAKIAKRNL